VMLDVAQAVEVVFGAGEGEVGEAGGAAEGRVGLRGESMADEIAAAGEVGEQIGLLEATAGELFVELGAATGVHAFGALIGLPGVVVGVGVAIDKAEDVVGNLPERVDADVVVPAFGGAAADRLIKHREGGVELVGEEACEGGRVHVSSVERGAMVPHGFHERHGAGATGRRVG
jgi:hypothetical protein